MDWRGIFLIDGTPLEMIIRGTKMYLAIFILLRVIANENQPGAAHRFHRFTFSEDHDDEPAK